MLGKKRKIVPAAEFYEQPKPIPYDTGIEGYEV